MESALQTRRRQRLLASGAVAALVGVVILGLYLSDPKRRIEEVAEREVAKSFRTPAADLDPAEVWMTRSEAELTALRRDNQELERQLNNLTDRLERLQQAQREQEERRGERSAKTALPLPPPLPAPQPDPKPDPAAAVTSPRPLPLPPPSLPTPAIGARPAGPGAAAGQPAIPGMRVVDLRAAASAGEAGRGTPAVKSANRSGAGRVAGDHTIHEFIPAGSFARAALLAGVDAPTGGVAEKNPVPVLLTLLDHGTLPNRFRSRVRECHIIAAARGDLASERVYFRAERLSCVLRDGAVVETLVDGYITGEDGKAGMRGRVVSKQGQLIARALVAGVAGGIGKGLSQSLTSLSTSALGAVQSVEGGNIAKYGLSEGMASALDRIAEWYLKRADEVYPVIEVDSGRIGELIIKQGVDLGVDILRQAAAGGEAR